MVARCFQKLTAWLCLVAALFMGVAPTNGLVLCFEPSGSLTLEAAVDGRRCGGCPDFAPPDFARSDQPQPGERITDDHSACLCVDILVSGGNGEDRIQPKPFELHVAQLIALPVSEVGSLLGWRPELSEQVQAARPRATPLLALIRSVVLLV